METIRNALSGLAMVIATLMLVAGCSATIPAQQEDLVAKLDRDSGGR